MSAGVASGVITNASAVACLTLVNGRESKRRTRV
jgi:hypothetical protein